MSGGELDYLYSKVENAADAIEANTPERRAFVKHLYAVSAALKAIEWNMSGDGDPDELELILACIQPQDVLVAAVETAKEAARELGRVLEMVKP